MADLSELLGDVYGATESPGAGTATNRPVLDDDLAAALSAALTDTPRAAPPVSQVPPSPELPPAHTWQRADDDILPDRPRMRRRRRGA